MGQSECKPCGATDPATSTVKVDPTLLTHADAKPPAIQAIKQSYEDAEQRAREMAEEERRKREEREREEQLAKEAEQRAAKEKQAAERARAEAEARERQRLKEEAEIAERLAEEQARARAEEAEQRRRAEQEAKAAQQRAKTEAQKKVDMFLAARGFKSVATPKSSCMKMYYPLHKAVEEKDADMVKALLVCGADQTKKNSSGKTPREWAQKLGKKGSHDLVLAALAAGP